MKYLKLMLLPLLGLALTGCRTVNYRETTTYPDKVIVEKHVSYGVLGFDTKLGGLTIEANKDSKKITLQDLDTNGTHAVDVIGKLVDKVPSYGGGSSTTNNILNPPEVTRLPPRRPETNPVQ
jgi:hypothetical protein